MSTKTNFKRVAAVAAAALAIGGFSAVSAFATDGDFVVTTAVSNAGTATAATASAVAGTNNFVGFTLATASTYAVTVTGGTAVSSATNVTGSGTASLVAAANAGTTAFNVPTPVVGSIVVKAYPFVGGVQQATATSSLTITVTAALSGTVYNHSAVVLYANGGSYTVAATTQADLAAASRTSAATYSATDVARIAVDQFADIDTTTVSNTYGVAVSATITGAGSIDTQSSGATRGAAASIAAGGNHLNTLYIFPDGRSGLATITVSVNGVVAKTYTWTFSGTTASVKEDTAGLNATAAGWTSTVSPEKKIIGVGETGGLAFVGYDANGNLSETAPAAMDYATTADSTIATATAVNGVVTVTGVKAGTTTVTICNATCSLATATIKGTATVTIGSTTVSKVVLSFDKDTYAPGEKMVLSATAYDSTGALVADGARDLYATAPSSNVLVGGTAPTFNLTSETIVGGVKTYSFYAPLAAGTVTFSGGTDVATVANALSASATIVNAAADSAQAAIDAAQEATDAANAAYDAANNAMDSADAATAAAQDAADNASAALAAVTSLSATVAKLVKSVSALATALAAIKKKLGVK